MGGEDVYLDEEGKFGGQTAGFMLRTFEHDMLMGRALVIGTDEGGNSISTHWQPEEVEEFVTWLDTDAVNKLMELYA